MILAGKSSVIKNMSLPIPCRGGSRKIISNFWPCLTALRVHLCTSPLKNRVLSSPDFKALIFACSIHSSFRSIPVTVAPCIARGMEKFPMPQKRSSNFFPLLFFTRLQVHSYAITLSVVVLTAVVFALAGMVNEQSGQMYAAMVEMVDRQIGEIMAQDPELALRWRMATRDVFQAYLGRGYEVWEIFPDDQLSHYLLIQSGEKVGEEKSDSKTGETAQIGYPKLPEPQPRSSRRTQGRPPADADRDFVYYER